MKETLYKKSKSGAVQSWVIEILPFGVMTSTSTIDDVIYPSIRIEQGQLNGKKQYYTEQIAEGKQNRTVFEQAELIVKSRISEQKDKGYKSLEDLKITKEYQDDFKTFGSEKETLLLETVLKQMLPEDCTDASGNLKPMKCTPIDKAWHKVIFPAFIQRKLDGVRCFILYSSIKKDWIAISSSGKSYNIAARYILEEVRKSNINEDLLLDGELYIHGIPLQILSGLARTETEIPAQLDLEYHIFDIASKDKMEIRRALVAQLFLNNEFFKIIEVKTKVVHSREEIQKLHDKVVEEGYEGIITRNFKGLYEFGRRSTDIFKLKAFQDEEFEILNIALGKRGTEDMVFVLKANTPVYNTFRANPIGDRIQKEYWWNNHASWEGKQGTVRFLSYSLEGLPQGNPILKHIRPKGE